MNSSQSSRLVSTFKRQETAFGVSCSSFTMAGGSSQLNPVEPARFFELARWGSSWHGIVPARPRSSWLDVLSWPDEGRAGSTFRASSAGVEPARLFVPARPGSSQLDLSSQLDGGRASSTFQASSAGVEPARFFEPARRGSCQLDNPYNKC